MSDPQTPDSPDPPGTFLSYAWTGPDFRTRVRRLAERLEEDGVRVVVDFLDLALGADADAYMERMVTDPGVTKVLLLCNPTYKRKADARDAGVGTESQIITQHVYAQRNDADQPKKYLAVVMERDEDGRAPVPAYYGSRVYLDLSDEASFDAQYEDLVAFLFDKPLDRPERGRPPADVLAAAGPSLGTATRKNRALRALRDGSPSAPGALAEYFSTFVDHLERFRFSPEDRPSSGTAGAWATAVRARIADLAPYRTEAAEVFDAVALYDPHGRSVDEVRSFFERLDVHSHARVYQNQIVEIEADPFRFFWEELFLLATAAFLNRQSVAAVERLVRGSYVMSYRGERMSVPFHGLQQGAESLSTPDGSGRQPKSPIGQLLQTRATSEAEFERLVEADVVLYLSSHARGVPMGFQRTTWFPSTAVYTERMRSPFPLFLRAGYNRDDLRMLLGLSTDEKVQALFAGVSESLCMRPSLTEIPLHPDPYGHPT